MASLLALTAGILAMTSGPLFAAPTHDACDTGSHGCATIGVACCCGDESDARQVPPSRADAAASTPGTVTAVPAPFVMPAVTVLFVHEGSPMLARPPDLPVLFSDLRL